mmetsp:Transcript_29391/g.67677  ORF Transcript_29391/g.67677 Transcript_29391/m.67677 type:complete len:278 (+) Transcript_29391:312-1145(+)
MKSVLAPTSSCKTAFSTVFKSASSAGTCFCLSCSANVPTKVDTRGDMDSSRYFCSSSGRVAITLKRAGKRAASNISSWALLVSWQYSHKFSIQSESSCRSSIGTTSLPCASDLEPTVGTGKANTRTKNSNTMMACSLRPSLLAGCSLALAASSNGLLAWCASTPPTRTISSKGSPRNFQPISLPKQTSHSWITSITRVRNGIASLTSNVKVDSLELVQCNMKLPKVRTAASMSEHIISHSSAHIPLGSFANAFGISRRTILKWAGSQNSGCVPGKSS